MSTGTRGDAAVLLTSAKLVEAGIGLLKPASESLVFDLVAFESERFYKIQVKRAYRYSRDESKFVVSLRRVCMTSKGALARKYTTNDADFIISVIMETGDLYCFPIEIVANKTLVTLNPDNLDPQYITNKRTINTGLYKNTITLHNKIYKL